MQCPACKTYCVTQLELSKLVIHWTIAVNETYSCANNDFIIRLRNIITLSLHVRKNPRAIRTLWSEMELEKSSSSVASRKSYGSLEIVSGDEIKSRTKGGKLSKAVCLQCHCQTQLFQVCTRDGRPDGHLDSLPFLVLRTYTQWGSIFQWP